MTTRAPYSGTQRKLVLAFDVGTTFSGISYSILDPGTVPEIRGVTRYPAQEQVGGDSKIPTVVYYDRDGRVQAAGAEAIRDDIEDLVEDEGFKLHLRPKTKSATHVTEKIPALPPNKTAVDVLADFLRYLHSCAKTQGGTGPLFPQAYYDGPILVFVAWKLQIWVLVDARTHAQCSFASLFAVDDVLGPVPIAFLAPTALHQLPDTRRP
ncbi:hypothetical protein NLJ89_g2174 [Agrocybe chaxingu]|uniref:Uncharacterized protein n=1 Tax=Agrocybe chaxingu TaxID=84603 RepID=A0A9W8MXU5_9AGAR|nr:hypothetical protein NLJ89_g2174 [Agrocybe chaxingu]